jgi:prepilin-type processing-associated H-X9-DG protein
VPAQIEGILRGHYSRRATFSSEFHQCVWEAYNRAYHGQTAERIAERGGFGILEAINLLFGDGSVEVKDAK